MVKLVGPTRRTAQLTISETIQDLKDSNSANVESVAEIRGLELYNPNATSVYLKIFSTTSGSVTVSSDTPSEVYELKPGLNDRPADRPRTKHNRISFAVTLEPTAGATSPGSSITGKIHYGTNI